MTAPRPALVYAELAKLTSSLRPHSKACGTFDPSGVPIWCLACEYRWTYGAAHDRTVGESAGKTSHPATSPTETVANGKVASRDACERAFRLLKEAVKAYDTAESILHSGLKHADGRHAPQEKFAADSSLISRADRAAAHAAAERRRGRGQGFGEG